VKPTPPPIFSTPSKRATTGSSDHERSHRQENRGLPGQDQAQKDQPATESKGVKKAEIIRMHEKLERPEGMECLEGATYKIRTPLDDHALYVTINDIVLNMGTEHEQRRRSRSSSTPRTWTTSSG
jgi:hypothetical protein